MISHSDGVDLSIIVVSWNTRNLLQRCLNSVYAVPDRVQREVIVVDNGSTDGSTRMVRGEFPRVRLIENIQNAGFARANNQGFVRGAGRYLLMLNPDTEVRPRALATLVAFMDSHPDAGAAGAMLLNADGTPQTSCYPEPTLFREFWRLFHLDALWPRACYPMASWPLEAPRQVEVAQGACLILRRDALSSVGLLDEDYFIYSEEVDLCHRMRRAGWRVYWVPQAAVVHHGGRSTCQVAGAMFLRLYEGKVLFFRKHRGQVATQLYKLILFVASIARLSLGPLILLEDDSRRRRHLNLAGHYWRLVQALPRL